MKLYKKDTKGKIRLLNIYTDESDIVQLSGLVNGKHTERRTPCKPKNIGRSNETTAIQQAQFELDSKIKKKMREGYFATIKEAEESEVKLPMLAHEYTKHAKKLLFQDKKGNKIPVFVQPKLDGMRCFAICKKSKVILLSRDNVVIKTLPHINNEILGKIYKEDRIYDGELYVHGENFQTNMSLIKNGDKQVKLHIYDYPMEDEFIVRKLLIDSTFLHRGFTYLEKVYTEHVRNFQEIKDFHAKALAEKFEGTMIRHGRDPYKFNGRSTQLLKYKDFKDITCRIIAITPSNKMPNHGRPVVEWVASNGETVRFACGTKMTHKQREDLLKNKDKYIGKTAEVRYFEEYESGVPRFPQMVGIRLDK